MRPQLMRRFSTLVGAFCVLFLGAIVAAQVPASSDATAAQFEAWVEGAEVAGRIERDGDAVYLLSRPEKTKPMLRLKLRLPSDLRPADGAVVAVIGRYQAPTRTLEVTTLVSVRQRWLHGATLNGRLTYARRGGLKKQLMLTHDAHLGTGPVAVSLIGSWIETLGYFAAENVTLHGTYDMALDAYTVASFSVALDRFESTGRLTRSSETIYRIERSEGAAVTIDVNDLSRVMAKKFKASDGKRVFFSRDHRGRIVRFKATPWFELPDFWRGG